MRILVTGGTGLLGSAVVSAANAAGHEVLATRHESPPPLEGARPAGWVMLDVTDPRGVRRALHGVDAVVHTAYRRTGDDAERVNVTGSAAVARAAELAGALLCHVSSDVVFAGDPPRPTGYREDDPTGPVAGFAYGMQKASAERLVRAAHPTAVIARTTLLYDLRGGSSLERMVISSAHPGSSTRHFVDEFRCPAHVGDVAGALVAVLGLDEAVRPPVLHLGGPERMSRHEIATALAPHLGIDPAALQEGTSASVPGDRPADLELDSSLAGELVAYAPRALRDDGTA